MRPCDGDEEITIRGGKVRCQAFPIVILTSNGERDFPPAFLRRCLRLTMNAPDKGRLQAIVSAHLGEEIMREALPLIEYFLKLRTSPSELATDQLLNAIYMVTSTQEQMSAQDKDEVVRTLLKSLDAAPSS